jgi:hypothetical protein
MKKCIRIWVTLKRVTRLIRISLWSLNNWDCEKWGNFRILFGIGKIFGLEFFKGGSEKGSSRKHTGNRVTRWRNLFWGKLEILRWIAKRIWSGEFNFGIFWGFRLLSTWVVWGGGTVVLLFCVFGGILCVELGWWGNLGWECSPIVNGVT